MRVDTVMKFWAWKRMGEATKPNDALFVYLTNLNDHGEAYGGLSAGNGSQLG